MFRILRSIFRWGVPNQYGGIILTPSPGERTFLVQFESRNFIEPFEVRRFLVQNELRTFVVSEGD
jgi:hypothetical protein